MEQKRTDDLNVDASTVRKEGDRNPDPITGAPGSHPVGTGIGAAGAGAIGTAIGAVAGPIGALAGAAIGAVVGGLAGKGVAEAIDPTVEDSYWRENYRNRPYVTPGATYDEYQPAYKYGWESRVHHNDRKFDEVESDLGRDWDRVKGSSSLKWEQAKHATRDAFHRFDTDQRTTGAMPGVGTRGATMGDAVADSSLNRTDRLDNAVGTNPKTNI